MIKYVRVDATQINRFSPNGESCTFDIFSPLFEEMKGKMIDTTATFEDTTGLDPLAL